MILAEVVLNAGDDLASLSLTGHAGMADEGQDLVCAGVSSCFIGSLNALENPERATIEVSKGLGSIIVKSELSVHDKTVLEVLFTQLQTIAEKYSSYLKINISKEGTK